MFLCVCTFTREEKNFYNKNCLFYAKFFKFEEFFVVASSLSILWVSAFGPLFYLDITTDLLI